MLGFRLERFIVHPKMCVMKVQKNQFSMQVLLEMTKVSKDGRAPISIRLTVSGRRKKFYLGVKILPERFSEQTQLVKLTEGNCAEAHAINKVIKRAKVRLYKQWAAQDFSLGHVGQQTTAQYLNCFTLNTDGHES